MCVLYYICVQEKEPISRKYMIAVTVHVCTTNCGVEICIYFISRQTNMHADQQNVHVDRLDIQHKGHILNQPNTLAW